MNVNNDKEALMLLKLNEKAIKRKLHKLSVRIKILSQFISETKGKNIMLKNWMLKKGLNYKDFFTSIGYYTTKNMVTSDDSENRFIMGNDNMVYHDMVGYHQPKRKYVEQTDHDVITTSPLGMTWNPMLSLYFPNTNYDLETYQTAKGKNDNALDLMGGFKLDDIGNMSAFDGDAMNHVEFFNSMMKKEHNQLKDKYGYLMDVMRDNESHSGANGSFWKKVKQFRDKVIASNVKKELQSANMAVPDAVKNVAETESTEPLENEKDIVNAPVETKKESVNADTKDGITDDKNEIKKWLIIGGGGLLFTSFVLLAIKLMKK